MIKIGCLIAIACVTLATIQSVRCDFTEEDLKQVCSKLREPTNTGLVFLDEYPMADKYKASLSFATSRVTLSQGLYRTLNLVGSWQRKLKNMNKCNGRAISLVKMCTPDWKKKQMELESAITYAYFDLVRQFHNLGRSIAALITINHLKSLRTRYNGVPISLVLSYEEELLKTLSSCEFTVLDRLFGVSDNAELDALDELYKGFKQGIISTDYIGRVYYMESLTKLLDIAYEHKRQRLSKKHAIKDALREKPGVWHTMETNIGIVDLRYVEEEKESYNGCSSCGERPWWYEDPLPLSYCSLKVFQGDNTNI